MLDAAGDAAVFAGNVVDRDDAIADGVLLVGAEVAGQLSATEPWSSTLVLTTCEAFRPPHVGHHEGSLLIRSW